MGRPDARRRCPQFRIVREERRSTGSAGGLAARFAEGGLTNYYPCPGHGTRCGRAKRLLGRRPTAEIGNRLDFESGSYVGPSVAAGRKRPPGGRHPAPRRDPLPTYAPERALAPLRSRPPPGSGCTGSAQLGLAGQASLGAGSHGPAARGWARHGPAGAAVVRSSRRRPRNPAAVTRRPLSTQARAISLQLGSRLGLLGTLSSPLRLLAADLLSHPSPPAIPPVSQLEPLGVRHGP